MFDTEGYFILIFGGLIISLYLYVVYLRKPPALKPVSSMVSRGIIFIFIVGVFVGYVPFTGKTLTIVNYLEILQRAIILPSFVVGLYSLKLIQLLPKIMHQKRVEEQMKAHNKQINQGQG